MSDLDRLTREATTKAVIAVGRDAAKRAANMLSGEDAPASEEKTEGSKPRRWKLIASVVLGLFLLVGVIGLLLNYWLYFLAAGALGVVGLVGWSRLRKRTAARKLPRDPNDIAKKEHAPALASARVRLQAPEAQAEPAAPDAAKRRAEVESDAQAVAEARATREQEVDDELAAMKARLKR